MIGSIPGYSFQNSIGFKAPTWGEQPTRSQQDQAQFASPEQELESEVFALLAMLEEVLGDMQAGPGSSDDYAPVQPQAPAPIQSQSPAPVQAQAPVEAQGPSNAPVPSTSPIGPGHKVLMIGDSHTVGSFGDELTKDLRSTGAQVSSYGSSGSSPSWWINGTDTHSGFIGRHADGTVDQPANWQAAHATPKLQDLINQEHPDTLVVNLGANFRGASPQQIQQQVADLGKVAQQNGCKLIWVGPPNQKSDMANGASMNAFNSQMQQAVAPYGTYVASSPYTRYSGPDGIHYNDQAARPWADAVFNQLKGG